MEEDRLPLIDVTPSKYIYNALAADVDFQEAIGDLLDNAIDSGIAHDLPEPLEIDLRLNEERIELTDHAGGITLDELPLILMPGGAKYRGAEDIKGVWGVGAKRALFTLGRRFSIRTRAYGHPGLVLDVDESWFEEDSSEDKWSIEYREDATIEEGTTTVTIEDLKVKINSFVISEVRRALISTHSDEIDSGRVVMRINEQPLMVTPRIPFAKSKYAPPTRYVTDIPVPRKDRQVHVEITLGVMTKPGGDYAYGVDLIGNRRVILKHNLDWRTGFVKKRLGRAHPTINRFRAVVRLTGHSKDIPWDSAKSDVNPEHPLYSRITDLIYQISRQYVTFLRKHYDVTSKLFRTRAKETDIAELRFTWGEEFETVVKDYREKKNTVGISYEVDKDDFEEVVKYFGLARSPRKRVGLFTFEHVLEEVVRVGTD